MLLKPSTNFCLASSWLLWFFYYYYLSARFGLCFFHVWLSLCDAADFCEWNTLISHWNMSFFVFFAHFWNKNGNERLIFKLMFYNFKSVFARKETKISDFHSQLLFFWHGNSESHRMRRGKMQMSAQHIIIIQIKIIWEMCSQFITNG